MAQREEVVVDCGANSDHINEETYASKAAAGSSSSNKLHDSQAKFNEFNGQSVQARNQENIQQPTRSPQETPRFNSNASSPRCPWTSSISRTKSRLIDLPEESFKSRLIDTPEQSCISTPDRINSERRQLENEKYHKQDDFEDMQDEFKRTRFTLFNLLQWAILASIVAALLCNLWISELAGLKLCELHLWEWEIMILVLICGRLFSGWAIKTILVKALALSFHVKAFFKRIQEALFKLYVIETLSHPPASSRDEEPSVICPDVVRSSNKKKDGKISIEKLDRLNKRNISVRNMKRMTKIIRVGSFNTLDEQILNAESDIEDEDLLQKTSEWKARQTARKIFRNLQRPGSQYFTREDVMKFMCHEEHASKTIQQFGAASEEDSITESCVTDWVVKAFRERRELALSLNDTKTAVDELHNILNIIVAIIILIIWLAILGVPILHFVVIISSQILLAVFVFGNTCRMQVEEMNILTTIFLKFDNQKITYPNNILATKPIGNYQRSPDMGDAIDFCIHISTPMEKVAKMRKKIIECVESRSDHWYPEAMVIMRDVVELNRLCISLWLTHKMNFQDIKERWTRRSLLIEEMIKVFKELDIEYRLLPLDVNVRCLPNLNSNRLPSTWTTYGS